MHYLMLITLTMSGRRIVERCPQAGLKPSS